VDHHQNALRIKLAILTRGLKLPSDEIEGRKGGAGPTRGRYVLLNRKMINAPMYSGEQAEQMNSILIQKEENSQWRIPEFETVLTPIPPPAFYQELLPNRTPMRKVALLHGVDCLATTIIQRCDYWPNSQCLFCGIPYSYLAQQTILQKDPEDFLRVIRAANRNKPLIKHVTLTSGTLKKPDRGIQEYIEFVRRMRKETDIPIHIQVEPPENPTMLDPLVEVGVDTVGIHIEIFDDQRRQKYCPGKFQTASLDKYKQVWKHAVDLFGENQVSTYILLGLSESIEEVLSGVQMCAELGIIPLLTPFRPTNKTPLVDFIPSYINQQDIWTLHQRASAILKDAGINPEKSKAGCARCGGCSAIREAVNVR